jgi:hypothetical protein
MPPALNSAPRGELAGCEARDGTVQAIADPCSCCLLLSVGSYPSPGLVDTCVSVYPVFVSPCVGRRRVTG